MDNTQYIETMIGSAERIYIDTATLMENSVEQFIMKNADLFLASGKKLIVPKSVCSELARHLGPGNETKSALAMKAVALISQHQKIFEVENTLIKHIFQKNSSDDFSKSSGVFSLYTVTQIGCSFTASFAAAPRFSETACSSRTA